METKTILSEKFSLQTRDFIKGLVMAVLTAVLAFFYEWSENGFYEISWPTVGKVALGAAMAYIFKNWLVEPAKVITIAGSNRDAKVAQTIITNKIDNQNNGENTFR